MDRCVGFSFFRRSGEALAGLELGQGDQSNAASVVLEVITRITFTLVKQATYR
jgi:hypothetical protein